MSESRGRTRTAASSKNFRAALLGQLLTTSVNFISRRIFIRALGSEFMGLSGLCGHLLSFLSLIEPGFDAACAFYLYSPLAQGNRILTSQIMCYLKKIYRRCSFLAVLAGLFMTPVLYNLSGEGLDRGYVTLVWLLYLFDLSLSFRISYRKILPISDQRAYIVTTNSYIFFVTGTIARILSLYFFGSFIPFLATGIATGLIEELFLYFRIGKNYPFIENEPCPISKEDKDAIKFQVKSLFFHKLGAIAQGSVDNMSIFAYLGLSSGAIYSNYTMLSGICLSFISVMTGSIGASVGNLGVQRDKRRMERVFANTFFAVFLVGGILAISLFFIYPSLIFLWLGEGYVLGSLESAFFCINLFIFSVRRIIGVFLDGCGLFDKEKYKALIEAFLCAVMTLYLVPKTGISGAIFGQIFASISFSLWFEPYILYKYGFKMKIFPFLKDNSKYLVALVLSFFLSGILCNFLKGVSVTAIILKILFCTISTLSVFAMLFFDTPVFKAFMHYFRAVLFGKGYS